MPERSSVVQRSSNSILTGLQTAAKLIEDHASFLNMDPVYYRFRYLCIVYVVSRDVVCYIALRLFDIYIYI